LLAAKDYTVQTIPNVRLSDRNNHVSNPDGILSSSTISQINQIAGTIEDSLGIEVAVVAVESIGNNDARMFATDLFKYWGIGKKNKDNGLLIQLVTEPSQRSVVFETGYGIEGVLPDAITYRIQQQYMIPDMKAGDYNAGMIKGISAVKNYLLTSDYERESMVGEGNQQVDDSILFWMVFIFTIFIFGIILLANYIKHRPRKCPRCGKKTFVYVGRQTLQKPTYKSEGLAVDTYRCKNCGYTENQNHTLDKLRRSSAPYIIGGGLGGLGGGSRGGGFGGGFGSGGSWGGGRSGGGGSISRF